MPAEEGFLGVLGRLANTVMGGAPGGHQNVWNSVVPWLQDLTKNASRRWLPHLMLGIPCEVAMLDRERRVHHCASHAIAACEVCKLPCCLDHSFVDRGCAAVCYGCVSSYAQERAPKVPGWKPPAEREPPPPADAGASPPPRPRDERIAQRRAAFKTLGIKQSSSWPEIDAAYKKLLAKWHPDRHPTNVKEADARFKAIRSAYDFLKAGASP